MEEGNSNNLRRMQCNDAVPFSSPECASEYLRKNFSPQYIQHFANQEICKALGDADNMLRDARYEDLQNWGKTGQFIGNLKTFVDGHYDYLCRGGNVQPHPPYYGQKTSNEIQKPPQPHKTVHPPLPPPPLKTVHPPPLPPPLPNPNDKCGGEYCYTSTAPYRHIALMKDGSGYW